MNQIFQLGGCKMWSVTAVCYTAHPTNSCFVCLCHYSSSSTEAVVRFCGYDVMVFPLAWWVGRVSSYVWLNQHMQDGAACRWVGEKEQSCALEAPFSPLHSSMIGPEAGIALPRTRATSPSLRDLRQFPGKWHDLIRRQGQLGQLMFPHDHPSEKKKEKK